MTRFNHLGRLRIVLASLVLFSHAYPLTNHPELLALLTGVVTGGAIAVIGFFFISGFLVTRSWIRLQRPLEFAAHRFFRIWPALIAALGLGALLGVAVSTADKTIAATSAWYYFSGNLPLFTGIRFHIEGAFLDNPNKAINGSLWTLQWEVICYIVVFIVGLIGGLRGRFLPPLVAAAAMLCIYALAVYDIGIFMGSVDIALILFTFALGALSYFVHSHWDGYWLATALFAASVICHLVGGDLGRLMPVFLICAVITLISFTPLLPAGDAKSDPSYGIYIYAFPVQQLVVWFYPECSPLENMIYAFPVTYALAMLSWFYVEKPMIGLGKALFRPSTVETLKPKPQELI